MNILKISILILGLFVVAYVNAALGLDPGLSLLIGMAYGAIAVPVYALWSN